MDDSESKSPWGETSATLPSLDDLRVFLAVARSGSFRAAAKELYSSQPTLSRSVARLERDLGAELLERGARGVQLTPSGEVLLDEARRILDHMARLRSQIQAPDTGTLRIGATATNARQYLTPYLGHWIPQHPYIRTSAISGDDETLRARLEHGDCDAAIVSARPTGPFQGIHLEHVEVRAVIPATHPLAAESGPLRVTELADEPLLVNGRGFPSHDLLHAALERAGIRPWVAFECSVGLTLAAAAEAGMGIAVFGSTTPLDGLRVVTRALHQAGGDALGFDLFVTWPDSAAASTAEFCVGLATFHRTGGRGH